ncbi:MAG: dienelactone hydrolase family protein [Nevskia sp.]|nr:dienelactone hydrolase family protein [Nevskia sp.]
MKTLSRWCALVLLAGVLCTPAARAGELLLRYGSLQATAWAPDRAVGGRLPVLIFSHGFHGCDVQSRFLTQGLANAGYLVFAPNHRDAACHYGRSDWLEAAQQPLWRPDLWTASTYADRAADVGALIAALHADPRFRRRADWSRLGLVGHSLGGYTALGLAGAWPRWKLPGVRAVLALAPYSLPFGLRGTLAGIAAPVMFECGQSDFAITPMVDGALGSYANAPRPKYYAEFANAGHLAWTDSDATAHRLILAYSLAFLDHYVRGRPADPLLTHAARGVSALDFDSELGRGAMRNSAP